MIDHCDRCRQRHNLCRCDEDFELKRWEWKQMIAILHAARDVCKAEDGTVTDAIQALREAIAAWDGNSPTPTTSQGSKKE